MSSEARAGDVGSTSRLAGVGRALGEGTWTGAVAGIVAFVGLILAGRSAGSTDVGVGAILVIGFLYAVAPGAAVGLGVATMVSVAVAVLPETARERVAKARVTVVGLAVVIGCVAAWFLLSSFPDAGWATAAALAAWCATAVFWRAPVVLNKLRAR